MLYKHPTLFEGLNRKNEINFMAQKRKKSFILVKVKNTVPDPEWVCQKSKYLNFWSHTNKTFSYINTSRFKPKLGCYFLHQMEEKML